MRLKLTAKLTLGTLLVVAGVMLASAVVMAQFLAAEARQRAAKEAAEKTAGTLSALQIVDSLSSQNIRAAMKIFIREGTRIGDPAIHGSASINSKTVPDLHLGASSEVGNFALVDHIKELTGNTATLFVRQGEDFVRVSTNVLKPDGSRATGTPLDPKGRAYAAIHSGQPFYGVVDILGSPYMTGYEPIRDKSGQLIGIWYVGAPLSSLDALGKQISTSKVLNNGYIALLKPDGSVVFKPEVVRAEDVQARASNAAKGWIVSTETFGPWKYAIQAAYPEADVAHRARTLQFQLAVCSILMMVIIAIAEFPLVKRLVLKPVEEVIARMKNADINTSLNLERKDEIGELARAFNGFVANIREALVQVEQCSVQVNHSSEEFSSVSQQISANSEETSAQANAVSTATEEVNRNLQTVATATEEMSASISEIAKNATEAAKVAGEAMQTATKTNVIVGKLGESSAEIGQVIKTITSIAQKTDLLALNATVEAARAGEVGAGFAVVANEVKELAKQTAAATEDISRKIEAIQGDSKGAVDAISSITGIITRVNEISGTIAAAVEEQSATTSEMSRNLTQAAKGATLVTENISGVAQAAQNTSHGATDSLKAAQQLAQLSSRLRQLVEQFRLQNYDTTLQGRRTRSTSVAGLASHHEDPRDRQEIFSH